MKYQALARKWRPQSFSDVVGQQHVLMALINSLIFKKIHHAYLFSGIQGIGKTTIARLLAKGLNCSLDITAVPCNNCNNCREIMNGCSIDLVEIDAALYTKVDDTRDILDEIQYIPVNSRFKIYLIDEVHMLSRYSFNALLKTLEEPPDHVKFLLATTDPKKIPATIISRCIHFNLGLIDLDQILGKLLFILNKENIEFDIEAVKLLVKFSNGSMRDAISLLDQAIAIGNSVINLKTVQLMFYITEPQYSLTLIESIFNVDSEMLCKQLKQYNSSNINLENILDEIISILYRMATMQVCNDKKHIKCTTDMEIRIQKLSKSFSFKNIQSQYRIFINGKKDMKFSPDPKMGFEMTLLRSLIFQKENKK